MFHSQMNPAHVLAVCFSTIHFNIILVYVRFIKANTIFFLFCWNNPFPIYVKVPVSSEWRDIFILLKKMKFKRL